MDKIVSKKLPISHFFSTRREGVSKTPYNENNIALHVGDNERDVLVNRAALCSEIGSDTLVYMNQVHSNRVVVVDEGYDFEQVPACDALLTCKKDIALMVMVADCTPVILYDTKVGCVAVIHIGRAGAFTDILSVTFAAMQEQFNTESTNVIAVIGPSIHACCYEVNGMIAQEADSLGYGFAIEHRENKVYLDVNAIIQKQFLTCKIEEVDNLSLCSACHNDRFFSYRADKQTTGRFCAIVKL